MAGVIRKRMNKPCFGEWACLPCDRFIPDSHRERFKNAVGYWRL